MALTVALLALLAVDSAFAVQLSSQGRLVGPAGQSVDGTYDLSFALYKNPYTTAPLWSETWSDVSVTDGVFTVMLGKNQPLDPVKLGHSAELWIGVTVGKDDELARQRITTVPRAAKAAHAVAAGGFSGPIASLQCTGCIDDQDIGDKAITTAQLGVGSITVQQTGFGWAEGAEKGGAAKAASGVECKGCISKSELSVPMATQTDLLLVGTTLGKLGCQLGSRPIVVLDDNGKKKWSCASAANAHGMSVEDAWGNRWDGLPRRSQTWNIATSICKSMGGRLPTVTELWRNNHATGNGALSLSYESDRLWTVVAAKSGYMTVRLNDGEIYYGTSNAKFRCIWPSFKSSNFGGDYCQGPKGKGCYPVDEHHIIDAYDRAPLPLGSAMAECAFYNARIPEVSELETAIKMGLPNGSGNAIWVGEQYNYDGGAPFFGLRWKGAHTDWYYGDKVAGSGEEGISGLWHSTSAPFRCIGLSQRETLNAPQGEGGGYTSAPLAITADSFDRDAGNYFLAVDACYGANGHLLGASELWSLIRAGLPEGTGKHLWTASHTQPRPITLAWSGAGINFWPDNKYKTSAGHTYSYTFTSSQSYRCGFYRTKTAGAQPQCKDGGCFQQIKGAIRGYADGFDREPATYWEAQETCQALGGRLPSARDLAELIRAGLPSGTTKPVWTTSTFYDHSKKKIYKLVASWLDTNTKWFPADNLNGANNGYGKRDTLSKELFRCVWTNEVR